MSQFDFPRINFFGEAFINPPTANNNSLLPLVLYDPIKVKAIIPPRIYLSQKLKRLNNKGLLPLPEEASLLSDEDDQTYFEISPVNTPLLFKEWATTPLGQSPVGKAFHGLYDRIRTIKENQRLTGLAPAYWNYYGGMDFKFNQVTTHSVEIMGENNKPICYSGEDINCPPDLSQLLNATVNLKPDEHSNDAVMIDVIPSLAFYTQVFCDSLVVKKENTAILKGQPSKASLRFLNINRIVNQEKAIAGSGTLFCVIPTHDLADGESAPILEIFQKYAVKKEDIAGVFIRYNLFEVAENAHPDYKTRGKQANAARCSVLGSISPWNKSDLKSITMGRQMVPVNPFYKKKHLPPFVCCFDHNRKVLMLDLISSIPEIVAEENTKQVYQTYNLGKLNFTLKTSTGAEVQLGSLLLNENALSRESFIKVGGLLEISYLNNSLLNQGIIKTGELMLYGESEPAPNSAPAPVLLMQESEYMVASEQAGMYANQSDLPEDGYRSYSNTKEPCRVTVYHKGQPLEGNISMTIVELRFTSLFKENVNIFLKTAAFKNNQTLLLPITEPANVIYVFYPGNAYKGTTYLITDLLASGFFINFRILPKPDYGPYLNPEHPHYPTPVSFDLIYDELLQVYDLIYPSSSVITPFTEAHFKQGWKYIKKRLNPDNWHSATYMPSSRELSDDQWRLICKWAE